MQLILTSRPPGLFERNFLQLWNPWSFGKLTRHSQGRQKAGANGGNLPRTPGFEGAPKML